MGAELVEQALEVPPFGEGEAARAARLDAALRALTRHHLAACPPYRELVAALHPRWEDEPGLAGLPWVPIGLFKRRTLVSVPEREVFKTVTSSGTTGASVSRVHLDRATARRQARALASIMQAVLGPGRRPMLVVDTEAVLQDRTSRSARAAGIVGLMSLGHHHTFALDADMRPQPERVRAFLAAHPGQPLLVFGFTYMVWRHLVGELAHEGIDLRGATLVHSGGWKQLEAERVDAGTFATALREAFGIEEVVNYYGMAEQVGAVFVEGRDGRLHPSAYADVIVRDPDTWTEAPVGRPGVLQVLSVVPTSYPGHAILTEDLGVVEAVDDPLAGPMGGKAFRVLGRIPRAELRGCSDTYGASLHA